MEKSEQKTHRKTSNPPLVSRARTMQQQVEPASQVPCGQPPAMLVGQQVVAVGNNVCVRPTAWRQTVDVLTAGPVAPLVLGGEAALEPRRPSLHKPNRGSLTTLAWHDAS